VQDKEEWNKYVISDEGVSSEDVEKSFAKLCEEIYDLIQYIKHEVYEEEEYCNWLSVAYEEEYKKGCGCLDFAYGIYEIAEKMKSKLKALCRKIYMEQREGKQN
jgi:hypothetical protein